MGLDSMHDAVRDHLENRSGDIDADFGSVRSRDRDIAVRVSKNAAGRINARHRDGRTWSGDDAAAVLQSVFDDIETGIVKLQEGEYRMTPQHFDYDPGTDPQTFEVGVKIDEGARRDIGLVGEGIRRTRLKWENNVTNDNGLIMVYANGYMGFEIADMTLDGNKANVPFVETDGAGGVLTGGENSDSPTGTTNRHGAVYRNLEFVDQPGSGLYSGFHDGGFDYDARFDNLIARNCTMQGIHFDFPHSSTATNIICEGCGTDGGTNDWAISISGPSNAAGGNWEAQHFHLDGVSVYGGGWARLFGMYGVSIDGLSVRADGDLDQLWGLSCDNLTDVSVGLNHVERTGDPDANTQGVAVQDAADVTFRGGHIRAQNCVVFAGDGGAAEFTGTTFVPADRGIVCFNNADGGFTGCTIDAADSPTWTMTTGSTATLELTGVKCTDSSVGTSLNDSTDIIHEGTRNLGIATTFEAPPQSGDSSGGVTSFDIAHGLEEAPTDITVMPRSADAAGDFHVDMSNVDGTNIRLEYATAPPDGTDNLTWWIEAKR